MGFVWGGVGRALIGVLGVGGGVSPKGLVRNLLAQFFTLGS